MDLRQRILGVSTTALIALGAVAAAQAAATAGGQTFGPDGAVVTGSHGLLGGQAVAVDRTRRIVVAGASRSVSTSGAAKIARFLPNGRLDASFASGGVSTALPTFQPESISFDDRGRILVAGSTEQPGPYHQVPGRDLAVARLRVGGALDPTFGAGGIASFDLGETEENALAVQAQVGGEIRVAGQSGGFEELEPDLVLLSLGEDGGLNPTSTGEGALRVRAGGIAELVDAAYDERGQVVIAGSRIRTASPRETLSLPRIARFFPGGVPERGFGHDGVAGALDRMDASLTDFAFDRRGRILVSAASGYRFAAIRFDAGGRLDRSFGDGGVRLAGRTGMWASPQGVAVDSRGRILLAGSMGRLDRRGQSLFAVLRLRKGGGRDRAFGQRGFRLLRLPGDAEARAIVPYGRGAIAVGATGGTPSRLPVLALARYR
jgi:uncharacterized delta-60 repeat protein